jgi:uncharacterized membrane protein YfhO
VEVGEVSNLKLGTNSCSATVVVPHDAWVWISLAPVKGWRWRLDGRPVVLQQGPGVIQFVEVEAGEHRLIGRYRPPGLVPLATLSCGALVIAICWFGFEARRRCAVAGDVPDSAVAEVERGNDRGDQ